MFPLAVCARNFFPILPCPPIFESAFPASFQLSVDVMSIARPITVGGAARLITVGQDIELGNEEGGG